jgi:hypothetical protein
MLTITFTPHDTSSQLGFIILTHNAAGSPDSISVKGSGIPGTVPIVTNGSFEWSDTGIVDTTGWRPNGSRPITGWFLQVASDVNTLPVFQIVSDTVEQGSRALEVTLRSLGANPWDVQIVADSLPVTQGTTYNYSVWAKSDKAGATVNFTVGNYAFTEYGAIRPATLTTQWKNYAMHFTVNDKQTYIRAPIHFYGAVDTGNAVYIDNLQIIPKPVGVKQAASKLPSNFELEQNYPNPFNPTTVIKYQLPAVSYVTLKIYDVLGRVVQTLVDGKQNAGYYDVTFNASELSSGVYFYELRTDHNSSFKKMLLLK